jgi:hypothetical protein
MKIYSKSFELPRRKCLRDSLAEKQIYHAGK